MTGAIARSFRYTRRESQFYVMTGTRGRGLTSWPGREAPGKRHAQDEPQLASCLRRGEGRWGTGKYSYAAFPRKAGGALCITFGTTIHDRAAASRADTVRPITTSPQLFGQATSSSTTRHLDKAAGILCWARNYRPVHIDHFEFTIIW